MKNGHDLDEAKIKHPTVKNNTVTLIRYLSVIQWAFEIKLKDKTNIVVLLI